MDLNSQRSAEEEEDILAKIRRVSIHSLQSSERAVSPRTTPGSAPKSRTTKHFPPPTPTLSPGLDSSTSRGEADVPRSHYSLPGHAFPPLLGTSVSGQKTPPKLSFPPFAPPKMSTGAVTLPSPSRFPPTKIAPKRNEERPYERVKEKLGEDVEMTLVALSESLEAVLAAVHELNTANDKRHDFIVSELKRLEEKIDGIASRDLVTSERGDDEHREGVSDQARAFDEHHEGVSDQAHTSDTRTEEKNPTEAEAHEATSSESAVHLHSKKKDKKRGRKQSK